MVTLYVEGGGDTGDLKSRCREGFREFLNKAGLKGHQPRIVASGGRRQAYESFCIALSQGKEALLLVDSEGPVTAQSAWEHLRNRIGDAWETPENAGNEDCHLMVQCMENWFLADRIQLSAFFSKGFRPNKLPAATRAIESIAKKDALSALIAASGGSYKKGEPSFRLLALIDPSKVANASPWAKRFIDELQQRLAPAAREQ